RKLGKDRIRELNTQILRCTRIHQHFLHEFESCLEAKCLQRCKLNPLQ
ncbi:unnamed protein product, partial [Linum tenue]